MSDSFLIQFLVASLVGLGSGYVGSFMVVKRMSLVGDALSHVALPGIAISLLLNINPFFGAFSVLFLAIVGIWFLERKTELPSETLVGIFFTFSLAIGLLLTPEPELFEALFGNISNVNFFDFVFTVAIIIATIFIIRRISNGMILSIISKDLAKSFKIPLEKINFLFLLLVAFIVALGLKVAGTLLMGSLVIIPAAAAKNISRNMYQYTGLAMIFGVISAGSGLFLASYMGIEPGPTIVLSAGTIFLITLFVKKN